MATPGTRSAGRARPGAVAVPRPARRTAPVTGSGLYDPRFEHDACGVALVADLRGRPTHALVRRALAALEHLAHRGATGSEEDSGDGAGILLQVPHDYYAAVAGFDLPPRGHYATGIMFLPREADRIAAGRSALAGLAAEEGLDVLGWREVPVEGRALGSIAAAAMPSMHQLFVAPAAGTGPAGETPPRHRPPRLRVPQAGRAGGGGLLPRLAVGPHHRLQGHAHLAPAGRVLPRPVGRPADQRAGPRALAVLDQHLPLLAAGPSLPLPGPQRRDQHPGGQPQLDAGPRGALPDGPHPGPRTGVPDRDPGGERLGLLRRGARAAPPRRAAAAPRRAHDDPRGLGEPPHHGPGPPRLLPVPRLADGALGRPGGGGLHRRHRHRGGARPQRPAPRPVLGHGRRAGGAGQRGGGGRRGPRAGGAQGPPPARPHVPGRHGGRTHRGRRRDQGRAGGRAPLRRVAGRRPGRSRGPSAPDHAHPPARLGGGPTAPVRLHRRGAAAHRRAHGPDGCRARRIDGIGHRHRRAVGPAAPALRLLHPAVRAGHQPPARRHPRGAGDLAALHPRSGGQRARADGRFVPADRAARCRSSTTTTWPSCSTSTRTGARPGSGRSPSTGCSRRPGAARPCGPASKRCGRG